MVRLTTATTRTVNLTAKENIPGRTDRVLSVISIKGRNKVKANGKVTSTKLTVTSTREITGTR